MLRFVELPIISNVECEERLMFEVPASVMCVNTMDHRTTCLVGSILTEKQIDSHKKLYEKKLTPESRVMQVDH